MKRFIVAAFIVATGIAGLTGCSASTSPSEPTVEETPEANSYENNVTEVIVPEWTKLEGPIDYRNPVYRVCDGTTLIYYYNDGDGVKFFAESPECVR